MSITVDMLTIPDSAELAQLLQAQVLERKRLHYWPLSLIEEIRTPDRRYILKSQRSCAGVERGFYRSAQHPMILVPYAEGTVGNCDYLILPYAEGSTEDWGGLSDDEIRARVRQLSREFQQLGSVPVFFDFSTHDRFAAALEDIRAALRSGGLSGAEFERIMSWLRGTGKTCWNAPVGLLHGDLKGENILRHVDGTICVIDWQRPLYGPLPLEESIALLLENRAAASDSAFDVLAQLYLAHW